MTNVLITGGSEGIGLAVARLLAAESGTRVTLVARDERKLKEAVAALSGQGHDYVVADLSRREDTDALARRLTSQHYDVLINNAGVGLYGRFTGLRLEDQLKLMSLNMESVVVLSHAFLGHAKPGDALVNTASFLGYSPLPGAAVYSRRRKHSSRR
jgi:short-subunit dehydrogenase